MGPNEACAMTSSIEHHGLRLTVPRSVRFKNLKHLVLGTSLMQERGVSAKACLGLKYSYTSIRDHRCEQARRKISTAAPCEVLIRD